MTSFPYPSNRHLVERVDTAPPGAKVHRWVLRDDNQQHYHGVLSLDESPVMLELSWKADGRSREQVVGQYRLHLDALLAEEFIRPEGDDPTIDRVRVRFYRGDRGVVYVQARGDSPALAIGTVDLSG